MTVPANEAVLLHENLDGIAVLTLNREAARNSLSTELLEAMIAALAAIADDPAIRAVVIAANGPAFCAGHDLKELTARRSDADGGRAFFTTVWQLCSTMMQAVVRLPQPVIASVQGAAFAAGCQLVATCDLAVASSAASFATPGVNIGLFCSSPMVGLVAQCRPQARDGNAAHGRRDCGGGGAADRSRQPGGAARRGTQRSDPARPSYCLQVCGGDQDRQGGVLCPARDEVLPRLTTTRPR